MLWGVRLPNDQYPQRVARTLLALVPDDDSTFQRYRAGVAEAVANFITGLRHTDPRLVALFQVHVLHGGDSDFWVPSRSQRQFFSQLETVKHTAPDHILAGLVVVGLHDLFEARTVSTQDVQAKAAATDDRVAQVRREKDEVLSQLADLKAERDNLHGQVCAALAEIDRLKQPVVTPRMAEPEDRDAVILARVQTGEKHQDIADDLGISRGRVSQIAAKAKAGVAA